MIQNDLNHRSQEGGAVIRRSPRIGEPFNPWRELCGIYPPDIVAKQRDLSDGQKRLYERGVRWAGKKGVFWYSFPSMAEALGKSVRQVKDDMATLEAKGLVGHTRRRRQSNLYHFLWQVIFEVQSPAHQDRAPKVQDSPIEVQDSVKNGSLKVQPTARESCPSLNSVKKESSSSHLRECVGAEEKADDDRASTDMKSDNSGGDSVPEGDTRTKAGKDPPEVSKGNTNPAAEVDPAGETAPKERTIPTGRDDLTAAQVQRAQQQLRYAAAASMHHLREATPENLATLPPLDDEITFDILKPFTEGADFEAWLKSTVDRGLGAPGRVKSSVWALFRADARNRASTFAAQRVAAAQAEADAEISRARRQAEQAAEAAEAAAELEVARPALEAWVRIAYKMRAAGRHGLPRILNLRLLRTGELISPNALEAAIMGWKHCPECHERGLLGNAIDRDLRFCGCPAGIEESYSQGVGWPTEEIARVHFSTKSLLAAACFAKGLQFTADAIAASEVTDNGEVLEIRHPDTHFGIPEGDVHKAFGRLKWQRRIVITGGWQAASARFPPAAKTEAAASTRAPITQADIDRALAEHRKKSPVRMAPGRETSCQDSRPTVSNDSQKTPRREQSQATAAARGPPSLLTF